jgi:UDP-N-acetyl-D-mannosaminuronate dehydrogenase
MDIYQTIKGCYAVVLMVAHQAYQQLDLEKFSAALRTPILIDGRFILNSDKVRQAGFIFRGVGNGSHHDQGLSE